MKKYTLNYMLTILCWSVAILQGCSGNIGYCFIDIVLGVASIPFISKHIDNIFSNLKG